MSCSRRSASWYKLYQLVTIAICPIIDDVDHASASCTNTTLPPSKSVLVSINAAVLRFPAIINYTRNATTKDSYPSNK